MGKIVFFLLIVVTTPSYAKLANYDSVAKVSIMVVEENGDPIEDALVSVSFQEMTPGELTSKKGKTNQEGLFSTSNKAFLGKLYFTVRKDGFYKTVRQYQFKDNEFGRWKPWNIKIDVVLRPIINPVPMYARNSAAISGRKIEMPVLGEEVGFDLMAYDWVIPHGRGTHVDIYFKVEKQINDRKDFESNLSVRFPAPMAGIQVYREETQTSYGSVYPLPRMAPTEGYQNNLTFFLGREPGKRVVREPNFIANDINYIFRTRTVVEDGKLIKAMYGKIHGPIDFNPLSSETAKIYMKYYLNPEYTRNLEFDAEQNLFGPLPPLEQVGIK